MKNPGLALVLALVFVSMTGSVDALDWLVASIFGGLAAVLGAPPRRRRMIVTLRRGAGLPRFFLGVALEIARGMITTSRVLLRRESWRRTGMVRVPLGERSARGADVSALVASTAPGTVLVEMDRSDDVMILNVIDATDPDRIRDELDDFYETYQRPVAP